MGKRNLYPTLGTRGGGTSARLLVDFLAYCDGTEDVLSIADRLDVDVRELITIAEQLVAHDLVRATAPTPAAVVAVASGR